MRSHICRFVSMSSAGSSSLVALSAFTVHARARARTRRTSAPPIQDDDTRRACTRCVVPTSGSIAVPKIADSILERARESPRKRERERERARERESERGEHECTNDVRARLQADEQSRRVRSRSNVLRRKSPAENARMPTREDARAVLPCACAACAREKREQASERAEVVQGQSVCVRHTAG